MHLDASGTVEKQCRKHSVLKSDVREWGSEWDSESTVLSQHAVNTNHNKCLANAKRPCDCRVLCLRPKSSLCSCLHSISDMTSFGCRDQYRDSVCPVLRMSTWRNSKKRGWAAGGTMTVLRIPTSVSVAVDRPASYGNQTISSTRPSWWIQISMVDVINIAADHQMFMTLTGELSWQRLRRSAVDFSSKNEKTSLFEAHFLDLGVTYALHL